MKKLFAGEAFSVVRIRNFRLYLHFRMFLTMATLMQSVIVGWQIYDITHNVLWLGFIGLVEVIPQVSVSLFAGHFIDIWNRRKIINLTTIVLIIGAVILLVYSTDAATYSERYGVLPIFITIFLTGLSRGIIAPAGVALLGQLVPRNLYANAATWNSANWQVSAVLGPAIGGLVYGFAGIIPAYSLVLALYLSSFAMTLLLKTGRHEVTNNNEGIFVRIKQGIDFVFKTPELLGAFTLDMFAVLFGGAVAMLPVFASDILSVGPQGLGLLRASPAIGATLMAFVLMFRPPMTGSGRLLFAAVTGFGLCMIGFALSKNFYLSAALLLLSGAFDSVSVVIRGTILQLFTPDHMRGRVASVNSIFIGSSNELGAFESGVAAKVMGLVPSVIFGGFMTLAVVFITSRLNRPLRHLSLKNKM
ncbi:MAG: MFS transporter [Bacteroidales bacterium]|jgi:MFS family permease|nr:MFS transporter [Bacteroidales bacterium]MCU0407549.1 MFS transporter [Bacteroidales bacterium]